MPRKRLLRLVGIPVLLFLTFSGGALALAKLHLATPSVPAATGRVELGDPSRGATLFSQNCASCHGDRGTGGGIGPRLAGAQITLAAAKAQIDNGGGSMPSGLVSGAQEQDVLAYLAQLFTSP